MVHTICSACGWGGAPLAADEVDELLRRLANLAVTRLPIPGELLAAFGGLEVLEHREGNGEAALPARR